VYLWILQIRFVDFLLFLAPGIKPVIWSHKHHGAISPLNYGEIKILLHELTERKLIYDKNFVIYDQARHLE
jgi:hypothetical protein